jgi:hypothetical protein
VFSINVSNDGVNFINGIACQDATATASSTWITSKTINTTTTTGVIIPSGFKYYSATVGVPGSQLGTYTAVFEAGG